MKTNDLLILILSTQCVFQSCRTGPDPCTSFQVTNDSIAIYVKPFTPGPTQPAPVAQAGIARTTETQYHFVVRVVKKTPFDEVQQRLLQEGIKEHLFLQAHDISLPRSLFLYESLLPMQNTVQFVVAFERRSLPKGQELEFILRSVPLGFPDARIRIPFKCIPI